VALLPFVRLSLRLRGFKKTQEWLQRRLNSNRQNRVEVSVAADLVQISCRMVRAAGRYGISGATCLEESLTLWYFLRREGIAASLRIGVPKQAEKFEAHAWVEHKGRALNQSEEGHRHYIAFEGEFLQPGENS
jgi:hypothetical protein